MCCIRSQSMLWVSMHVLLRSNVLSIPKMTIRDMVLVRTPSGHHPAVENSFHHGTLWRPPPAPVTHPSTFKHFPPGISFILYPSPNLRRHINCMIALFFYISISAQPSNLEDPPYTVQYQSEPATRGGRNESERMTGVKT